MRTLLKNTSVGRSEKNIVAYLYLTHVVLNYPAPFCNPFSVICPMRSYNSVSLMNWSSSNWVKIITRIRGVGFLFLPPIIHIGMYIYICIVITRNSRQKNGCSESFKLQDRKFLFITCWCLHNIRSISESHEVKLIKSPRFLICSFYWVFSPSVNHFFLWIAICKLKVSIKYLVNIS